MSAERDKLAEVRLDEGSLAPASPNLEQERRIALFDLLESNSFAVPGQDRGPYTLELGMHDGRLALRIISADGQGVITHIVSLSPVRKLIKDYFLICESYYAAIRNAPPAQIEAIDMGRRGLHNEAADVLMRALDGKVALDHETARRLFTLICALQARG
ncbi:MAG: UPF0262 family protein [Hyphomonadaceae bacterium]|nr:UPF0262 family protein [Hyphomonadaceae bacterium]